MFLLFSCVDRSFLLFVAFFGILLFLQAGVGVKGKRGLSVLCQCLHLVFSLSVPFVATHLHLYRVLLFWLSEKKVLFFVFMFGYAL